MSKLKSNSQSNITCNVNVAITSTTNIESNRICTSTSKRASKGDIKNISNVKRCSMSNIKIHKSSRTCTNTFASTIASKLTRKNNTIPTCDINRTTNTNRASTSSGTSASMSTGNSHRMINDTIKYNMIVSSDRSINGMRNVIITLLSKSTFASKINMTCKTNINTHINIDTTQ